MNPNFALSALYALDNLEVMRGMDSESVPLIYLDPPFNSKRIYQGMSGTKASRQRFRDTWTWNDAKQEWLDALWDDHPGLYQAVMTAKEHSPGMGGYCAFMSVRLVEMHRILTPDGSIYLHCDPSANAYLRMLMDCVFGANQFRNEIVWRKYSGRKNNAKTKFSTQQDTILFYAKSRDATFNVQYEPISEWEIQKKYRFTDEHGRRYREAWGRHYQLTGENRRIYLDEQPGAAIASLWVADNLQLNTSASERTGWATQKPLALLERIIKTSSNPDDIVLDPFCGCGTGLVAAETLGRRWVGCDDDQNAVDVIRDRIAAMGGKEGALPVPGVQVLYAPPARTEVASQGDVIRDPTGYIIPKMPSDKMSNAQIREKLLEWQVRSSGKIKCLACAECLLPRHFHVDHIDPKSAGGTNRIDNRVLICGACNVEKGNTMTMPALWQQHGFKARSAKRKALSDALILLRSKARQFVQELDNPVK